jgi:hypothetical protein
MESVSWSVTLPPPHKGQGCKIFIEYPLENHMTGGLWW